VKFAVALILLFCGLVFYLFPYVKKERICNDTAFEYVRRLRISVPSKGTDLKEVCRDRVEMIATLQVCTAAVEKSNIVTGTFRQILRYAASFDHPFSNSFQSFTADHNTQCSDYPQYQFR
jgi:hypothetical protein